MARHFERIISALVLLALSLSMYGQSGEAYGAYSPYSIFGIGDISKEGTAYNRSMGGVGIAARNRRFVNYVNPAAITARDSLSFMADFGLTQNNKIYAQDILGQRHKSGNNTFNISDLVLSFPIWRSSAMIIGLEPFSDVGYGFNYSETDPEIVGKVGNLDYETYGEGSVYQLFVGAAATFWKRLSIGAQFNYYFGTLTKVYNVTYTDSSVGSVNSGYNMVLRGAGGKFGLQYDQPLGGDVRMIIGATYRLKSSLNGDVEKYTYVSRSSVTDTIPDYTKKIDMSGVCIADELGVGISVKGGEKWSVEFDYLRSGWNQTGIGSKEGFSANGFSATASHSFRAGFEIVPNRNDIRYYLRRCAYRAGLYYDRSYYKLDGNNVDAYGLTFGFTLPVFRFYNGLSFGLDLGQRGSLKNGMVRENYINFSIGFNIHDIWFQKPRYE